MLAHGCLLSSKIETLTLEGHTVYNVADGFLMACFAPKLPESLITGIAQRKPVFFVMRDASLENDAMAANFEQIFKALSPETKAEVL